MTDKNKKEFSKVKKSKIGKKSDREMEKEATTEENMSILVMILIVVLCFVIGISLGKVLYDIAINSSSAVIMFDRFIFL